MVPPTPSHIAFPEVKRQTSLKYHPGLQPARISEGGQPGSPQGSALIYGGERHSAVNRGIHQITSWEDSVCFVRADTRRVETGTAPGRAECFFFSIKDGEKKKLSRFGGCMENCA